MRLPKSYTNSVFITLDTSNSGICGDRKNKRKLEEVDNRADDSHPDVAEFSSYADKPFQQPVQPESMQKKEDESQTRSSKLRKSLLEKLSLARNCVFNIEEPEHLEEALAHSDKMYECLLRNCSTNQGLPIRSSPEKKRLKVTSVEYHKVFHKKLPLRRKKKDHSKATCLSNSSYHPVQVEVLSIPEKSPIKVYRVYYFNQSVTQVLHVHELFSVTVTVMLYLM